MKKTPKEQIAKRLFAKKNSNKPYESKAFLDWADRIVPHYIYCCNGKGGAPIAERKWILTSLRTRWWNAPSAVLR